MKSKKLTIKKLQITKLENLIYIKGGNQLTVYCDDQTDDEVLETYENCDSQ